jgi:gamma-glutamyltranspeptidase/glutathione hydrolase
MGAHPADKIAANQEARAIFMPNGRLLTVGETLVQLDLARTLARIAAEGAAVFYDGEIGAIMGADFEANGGLVTLDDLRWTRPWIDPPGRGRYRGLELLTDDPPGLGVILLLIMRILEGMDLQSLEWNTPACVELASRTMQFAFADTGDLVAQGRSATEVLEPSRIDGLRARIKNGEFPNGVAAPPGSGTTHLAVIDRDHNVASWVHSSGSGSGVVTPGLGFVHNDHMIMFDPHPGRPSSLAPRTVPVHGGGPVIVLKDGRPLMAIGSPAGALKTTAITQVLLGVLEFGLPLQAAISSPRVHTQQPGVIMVEPSYPSGLARALAVMGHRIVISDYTARVSAVMVTEDGDLVGGADPRGGGGLEWSSG